MQLIDFLLLTLSALNTVSPSVESQKGIWLFKDVPLRTRRALSLYKVYGDRFALKNSIQSLWLLLYGYCNILETWNKTTRSHRLASTHSLVPKHFLCSSDWLVHSELGYFACSLISGFNDGAANLTCGVWSAFDGTPILLTSQPKIFQALCTQQVNQ